ncbi:MAG: 4-hydroxy-tetrahydrodipicolinate reductase, partial [Pseudomonadota bacterium]|nr:4-hydroxy-tetrahydrodipicolinate reductase [Pseudomonadota bacterium]
MLNVAVAGAAGRMGRTLIEACRQAQDLNCSVALERPDSPWLGADAGELAGVGRTGVAISAELTDVLDAFDVLVEFTRPE